MKKGQTGELHECSTPEFVNFDINTAVPASQEAGKCAISSYTLRALIGSGLVPPGLPRRAGGGGGLAGMFINLSG